MINERSALAQPRSQVFSTTRRSVETRTREPWERGCSLLTFSTDFICHSLENLLKFSQSDYPRAYIEFCQNLKFKKEKKLLSQCLLGLQAGTPLVIVGFHMTSLKFKLQYYRSYRDFTLTMY